MQAAGIQTVPHVQEHLDNTFPLGLHPECETETLANKSVIGFKHCSAYYKKQVSTHVKYFSSSKRRRDCDDQHHPTDAVCVSLAQLC